MGYNGGKRVWPQRNSGFSKSSIRFGHKMIRKTVLPAMKLGSSALGLTSSKKGVYRKKQNYYTDYKNATNTIGRFDEKYDLQIDPNEGLNFLGVFFLIITIILFVLAFADILWFGFCYFFGSISFILSVVSFSVDLIQMPKKRERGSRNAENGIYLLFLIGFFAIIVGVLPLNIYGIFGKPIIYLDVDSFIPSIIFLESIILLLTGFALIGRGVYFYYKRDKE